MLSAVIRSGGIMQKEFCILISKAGLPSLYLKKQRVLRNKWKQNVHLLEAKALEMLTIM
jgi:hypothetical protein